MTLSSGCVLCHQGAKMVLFVTGRCHRSCWYCPLSSLRKGKDVVYANEHKVEEPGRIIGVAESMSALGTGVTGGEPFLVLDRVVEYCTLLKEHFGKDHQIHLYTATAPSGEELDRIAGLVDEIRFHPPRECWDDIVHTEYLAAAQRAKERGFEVGFEVPALPGLELLEPALPYLDFLNINELEWGETNADEMRLRGYTLADDLHNAIAGARDWAEVLLKNKKVHWCSSSFKDSVQLRERLRRIAENTARPFDEITDDGTIVYGVVEPTEGTGDVCRRFCQEELEPGQYIDLGDRIETAWWLLAAAKDRIPGKKYVVERYPDGGIVVEVTPL
ncbi:MAG TPA: 4Fe-4S cluster-binding domain-containing protein [Methanoregulaceae archaeon]|nr:4Fe-4S cluster-binding domain-containing protein [Methanoregulaceae archaeon]HPD75463.1 4Fe-4S cluster-binding domain-containing protein [Methanoregulaceae archaeon]HRY75007.1 4Fe-4S cluster-binding domain-containing protein [Methanoregulaceae archaeon]